MAPPAGATIPVVNGPPSSECVIADDAALPSPTIDLIRRCAPLREYQYLSVEEGHLGGHSSADGPATPSAGQSEHTRSVPLASVDGPVVPLQYPSRSGAIAVPNIQLLQDSQRATRKRSGTTTNTKSLPKKRKTNENLTATSSSASTATNTGTSDTNPPWASKALTLFKLTDLGPEWHHFVATWLAFEQQSGFESSGRLPAQGRPCAVHDWIKRARPSDYRPEIKDIKHFAKEFQTWWQAIQPDWRADGADAQPPQERGWDELRYPGVNGILSVVAALFFWGHAIRGDQVRWRRGGGMGQGARGRVVCSQALT